MIGCHEPAHRPLRTAPAIKICGLTREQDVDAAVAAGADAVGFVLYDKSPRFVIAERAAELARRLPPFVTPVLLFVNAAGGRKSWRPANACPARHASSMATRRRSNAWRQPPGAGARSCAPRASRWMTARSTC